MGHFFPSECGPRANRQPTSIVVHIRQQYLKTQFNCIAYTRLSSKNHPHPTSQVSCLVLQLIKVDCNYDQVHTISQLGRYRTAACQKLLSPKTCTSQCDTWVTQRCIANVETFSIPRALSHHHYSPLVHAAAAVAVAVLRRSSGLRTRTPPRRYPVTCCETILLGPVRPPSPSCAVGRTLPGPRRTPRISSSRSAPPTLRTN